MAIRLIDTEKLCLVSFMGSRIPNYAILSHTWEPDGEISFQDMMAIGGDPYHHPAAKKSGYDKIVKTCHEAKSRGISHAWVDTVCIDKTSSSELSEAINSMYQWYQKAQICFAFLADIDITLSTLETALPECRWFTRGWCLQELIAPRNIDFFDTNWNRIGSKTDFTALISKITRIDKQILTDTSLIDSIPVGRRMSWAAERKTSREEDIAYCLLGIFGVNMPMLYGEGPRAFIRLQEEIVKTSNDLSLFAFTHSSSLAYDSSQQYCDLFATSPRDFIGCGDLIDMGTDVHWNDAFALTNKGLHFQRAKLQADTRRRSYSMLLNCKHSASDVTRMYLQKVGPGLFARYQEDLSDETICAKDPDGSRDHHTEIEEVYIIAKLTPLGKLQLERADEYAIHVWSHDYHISRALQVLQRAPSSDCWDPARMQFLTKGEKLFLGYWKLFPSLALPVVGPQNDPQAPPGHCYLVCGVEHPENPSDPRAWVRLYSLEEWRSLEAKFGIITQPNDAASPLNLGSTSHRITFGKSSTNKMTITATIKLHNPEGKPRFELGLGFEMKNESGSDSREQGSASHNLPAKDEDKALVASNHHNVATDSSHKEAAPPLSS
jgi:Heterokaryon incompatibility protein (HET)